MGMKHRLTKQIGVYPLPGDISQNLGDYLERAGFSNFRNDKKAKDYGYFCGGRGTFKIRFYEPLFIDVFTDVNCISMNATIKIKDDHGLIESHIIKEASNLLNLLAQYEYVIKENVYKYPNFSKK